jgi:hypothetical protein
MKPITVLTPDQVPMAKKGIISADALARITGRRKYETRFEAHRPPNPKIDLTWFTTKTLQPRWVPISDILAAILESHAKPEGSVFPRSHQRLTKLREKAEKAARLWPWPNNAARHSYISYQLALLKTFPRLLSKRVTILRRLLNGTGDRF